MHYIFYFSCEMISSIVQLLWYFVCIRSYSLYVEIMQVMYDASGVRLHAGRQAEVRNSTSQMKLFTQICHI